MRKIDLLAGTVFVMAVGTAAFGQGALNLKNLKSDTLVFEKILDERLKLGFSDPFAITENPQAAYLQGYGVVVSVHLNINRQTVRTPFGEVRLQSQGQGKQGESREEQLNKVRDIAVQCLADYAGAIKQLAAHDRISISAHVEDRNELDPVSRRTILVVTASRDDIVLLAMRKISTDEFHSRVNTLRY